MNKFDDLKESLAGFFNKIQKSHSIFFKALQRLAGITGFVSILGNDPRIEVFSRSHHVYRVLAFTAILCDQLDFEDRSRALLIAACHDINRLPFAHNLEKKIDFNQAANLPNFLEKYNIILPEIVIDETMAVISKETNGSPASNLVYAADVVAGFVEDSLFAITTLNLSLNSIPGSVAKLLKIEPGNKFLLNRIKELASLFHNRPDHFTNLFNKTVIQLGTEFLGFYNHSNQIFIQRPDFEDIRTKIKNDFLKGIVFPINNETVSQGSKLAKEVAIPVMNKIQEQGQDAITILLGMTDQQLLDKALELRLIDKPEQYYPLLPEKPGDLCRK
ncbi:MAG: HD domain-containing protein [Candidatus Aminicenantes bacterium]|jgi:hypothetical protein